VRNRHDQHSGSGARAQHEKDHVHVAHTRGEAIQKLTAEDIVVIVFALLGFAGSVILFVTIRSPIITACFLATGVASLIHRFLGGLGKTGFTWGALKASGSLAALLGVAYLVNHYLVTQSGTDLTAPGVYEWQYPAKGWGGHIDVAKNGSAKVYMTQQIICNGKQEEHPLLRQERDGKIEVQQNGRALGVNTPVRFINYENCTEKESPEQTVLIGTLDRKTGYFGQVEYSGKLAAPMGGMMLVKH